MTYRTRIKNTAKQKDEMWERWFGRDPGYHTWKLLVFSKTGHCDTSKLKVLLLHD